MAFIFGKGKKKNDTAQPEVAAAPYEASVDTQGTQTTIAENRKVRQDIERRFNELKDPMFRSKIRRVAEKNQDMIDKHAASHKYADSDSENYSDFAEMEKDMYIVMGGYREAPTEENGIPRANLDYYTKAVTVLEAKYKSTSSANAVETGADKLEVFVEGFLANLRNALEMGYALKANAAIDLTKYVFCVGHRYVDYNDEAERDKQRIWKQKYYLDNGRCILNEGIYDGYGRLLEGGQDADTGLDFIPCYVVINDGLTGDVMGESDVEELIDLQNAYNRLNSDDADALKFNMFPQTVATDVKAESLEAMRISPGALVDLQTDPATMGSGQAKLDKLESSFSYSERFEAAINRTKNDMFDLLSVPNVSLEQLKGLMQSGKSMKALYWELITRCEDKWASWEPALEWLGMTVLKMAAAYQGLSFPEDTSVHVEHLYPILEDDFDEMKVC